MSAGIGLIVCGVACALQPTLNSQVWVGVLADVIFAASVLLFAMGLSRDASVVGREPVGVAALVVVGVWPFVWSVVTRVVMSDPISPAGGSALGLVALLVPTAAGLLAGVRIVRSRVVPNPWRWAPLWVLGAYVFTWVIPQVVFVSQRPEELQSFASLFQALATLATLAGTMGLGILAIALAARQRPESVEIFPTQ